MLNNFFLKMTKCIFCSFRGKKTKSSSQTLLEIEILGDSRTKSINWSTLYFTNYNLSYVRILSIFNFYYFTIKEKIISSKLWLMEQKMGHKKQDTKCLLLLETVTQLIKPKMQH